MLPAAGGDPRGANRPSAATLLNERHPYAGARSRPSRSRNFSLHRFLHSPFPVCPLYKYVLPQTSPSRDQTGSNRDGASRTPFECALYNRGLMHQPLAALLALYVALALPLCAAESENVQLLYVGPAETSTAKGALQGLKEANVLGRFTGHGYQLTQVDNSEKLGNAVTNLQPAAVLAALDSCKLLAVSALFADAGVAVFNLAAGDDTLRQQCRPNLLHVGPSDRMRSDAVDQWRKRSDSPDVEALAWHQDFRKFAGRELNNRFRRTHRAPMDDGAWAGWAAVKMIAEAVARTRSTSPSDILVYLKEEMQFDGQKGVPHTFRDTGQLRQPLLIVENSELAGEAPVRGVVETDDLDSLGLATCKE